MQEVRIETEGLTPKEVIALERLLRLMDEVDDATFLPFLPGTVQYRSLSSPQMGINTLHLVVRLADGALLGIGIEASKHIYKKVGESIVDRLWDAISAKLTGKSVVEVGVKLYGPDNELIKEHKGKR
jgi:hypothetical protein